MTTLAEPRAGACAGVRLTASAAGLDGLRQPGCSAAIWPRQLPDGVLSLLDGLDPEALPRGRVILRPDDVVVVLGHLFDIAGMPPGSERDWLRADIAELADIFADLMSAAFLRLRLDVIATNACRKFHIDAVTARLVCTYRGSGTQYGLASSDGDPTTVFEVDRGAPILLRGTLWPSDGPTRLRHRSPPIEGTGETRLVLVLDPVFDPEEEA